MTKRTAVGVIILAASCTSALGTPQPGMKMAQTEKVCTTEYDPVCASKDGKKKTYSNNCRALQDGATEIAPGACENSK